MTARYDTIVVGAGLGGLTAATFLAVRGQRVLLLERRNVPGGYASSFVRGRFEFEAALHEITGVGKGGERPALEDLFEELGLNERIDFIAIDEIYRSIFPGIDITLPVGYEAFEGTLAEAFPAERAGIAAFLQKIRDVAREVQLVQSLDGRPNPLKIMSLLRYFPATWSQVLNRDVKDPLARAVLSQSWGYYGLGPSQCSFLYMALGLNSYIVYSPHYVKGRSQQMSNAFVGQLVEAGGEVRFSTGVRKITQSGGRVTGVITDQDEHILADSVVSNAHPIVAVRDLLGIEHLPRGFLGKLRFRRPSPGSFNIYLGLAQPPEALGLDSYETFINESLDLDEQARRMSVIGPPPAVAATTYNCAWPEISPPGTTMTVITALMYGEPWFHLSPEVYEETRQGVADHMLSLVERHLAPDLRAATEVITIATPMTNMRFAGTMAGALYGSAPHPEDSTVLRVGHRGPLGGLYFVGAWTPPGGGMMAAILSGRAGGGAVLEDRGVGKAGQAGAARPL